MCNMMYNWEFYYHTIADMCHPKFTWLEPGSREPQPQDDTSSSSSESSDDSDSEDYTDSDWEYLSEILAQKSGAA